MPSARSEGERSTPGRRGDASSPDSVSTRCGLAGIRARTRTALARRFGIDARALAAFRVALAALVLADLLLRSRDFAVFHTDAGVLPRSVHAELFPALASLSIYAVSGDPVVQGALFVATGAFAVALLVGFHSRIAATGSALLLVSLLARNPLVLNAGDVLLAQLAMVAVLLPLGERWSIDALVRDSDGPGGRTPRRRVANLATALVLVVVVGMYATNAVLKLRSDRWMAGDAVQYVLRAEHLTTSVAAHVAPHAELLVAANWLWVAMLLGSGLLVLLTGRLRAAFVSLFVGVHLGMLATMRIGLFPLISVAALLLFLPSSVWRVVESSLVEPLFDRNWPPGRLDGAAVIERLARTRAATPVPASSDLGRLARRGISVVAVVLLVTVVLWNVASVGYVETPEPVPSSVDPEENRWGMFAPNPPTETKWHEVTLELESGERVDALDPAAANGEFRHYPNERWRKYLDAVPADDSPEARGLTGYLCASGAPGHDAAVERVAVDHVKRSADAAAGEETTRVEVVRASCE